MEALGGGGLLSGGGVWGVLELSERRRRRKKLESELGLGLGWELKGWLFWVIVIVVLVNSIE